MAQFLLVKRQTIWIIAGARAKNAGQPRLFCDHFTAQLTIRKLVIADDVDLANFRFRSFVNFKDDIDAVLVKLNQFRFNRSGKTALAFVKLNDASDVGTDFGTRIDLARRQFDLRLDLFILQPLVTFKDDTVDDRVFADFNRHIAIGIADADIGEQFSGV